MSAQHEPPDGWNRLNMGFFNIVCKFPAIYGTILNELLDGHASERDFFIASTMPAVEARACVLASGL